MTAATINQRGVSRDPKHNECDFFFHTNIQPDIIPVAFLFVKLPSVDSRTKSHSI